MQRRPEPPSLVQAAMATFSFPWQGAVMVLSLTAGAAIRQHPGALRPVLHTVQAAALFLVR